MTLLRRLMATLALASMLVPAHAVDEADLLPVDQAFVLSAGATSRDSIEVRWRIAEGYYLYRHRTAVQALGTGSSAGTLQLPKGKAYNDEFFGAVETYRDQLLATLPGVTVASGDRVILEVKYQGCADAGICYPPQTRTVAVNLPSGSASASGSASSGLPTRTGGLPLFGKAAAGASDALPLPQERAFAFDAIVLDGNQLLLRFTPAPGYYVYRDRTTVQLDGAAGIKAATPRWPAGTPYRDEHFGEVTVYFDQAEVPLPLQREHARAAQANLRVTFQGCQDEGICYPPMARTVRLDIPAGAITPPAAALIETPPSTPTVTSEAAASQSTASTPPGTANPVAENTSSSASVTTDAVPRTTPPPEALRKASRAPSNLAIALLLALAGGVILNLMPCVLPVLSLKALSLADGGRSGSHARAGALWYTAGVLLSFITIGAVAIGLRAAGQALGWGFQLQQPLVIGVLAYLMFAVGLSLSGVFAFGHRFAGTGHDLTGRTGPAGDFFTGVLAVVIASPCTAPFMGAALAFAFTASTPVALLVFAVLGLGLALPFLLIGFIPALAQRLPRPGPWMETLKQFLAFPMYLTVVWLLWVLGKQRGVDAVGLALVGMVLLALGLWWYQRLRFQVAPLRRALAVALLVAAIVPLAWAHRLPANNQSAAPVTDASAYLQPYSPARLSQLRAQGRVVFVEMTADWCVTCKANDRTVLSRADFRIAMAQADAVFMRGDWTTVDPEITAFLQAHDAYGVPLYVMFPADGGAGEVLPTVLTADLVTAALQRAAR